MTSTAHISKLACLALSCVLSGTACTSTPDLDDEAGSESGDGDGDGGDGDGDGDGDGGDGGDGDGDGDGDPAATCTSVVPDTDNGTFVELCAVEGKVAHVRIEDLVVPAMHATAQIYFGFEAPPAAPDVALEPDQFNMLFYGGPPALVQAVFGESTVLLPGDASGLNAPSTVCFDLHDGDDANAPALVLWLAGHLDADCHDPDTLTLDSAFAVELDFGGHTGAITAAAPYFHQSAGSGSVTITSSNAPVTSIDG